MFRPTSPPHFATLVLLTAVSTLSLNMFLPSLATIAADLGTPYSHVSIAVSGYLAATSVVLLVVGPLSDRIGRRPVMLGSLVLFIVASIGCVLAQNIWVFLVFRMMQGAMIAGHAISLAVVRDTASERKAASLIGYLSMAMAVAPMLGPLLGGILDATFGWRSNFVVYAASGLVMLALCLVDLGETRPRGAPDRRGAADRPTVLLKEPRFWGYALVTMFSTGAFYVFLAGSALVAQSTFGIATVELGIYIGSITGGFMFGGFLSGMLAQRLGLVRMMVIGRTSAALGPGAGLVLLTTDQATALLYFGCTIFVGIGNGLTTPSSNAGAMSVRPDLAGSAAGLNGSLNVAGGAALTLMAGYMLTPENAALMLLTIIFAVNLAGLATAIWTGVLERRRAAENL